MSAQVFKSALAISKDKIMPLRKCVSSDLLRVCKIAMPWYKDIFGVQTEYAVTYYPSETFLLADGCVRHEDNPRYTTLNTGFETAYSKMLRCTSILEMAEYLQKLLCQHETANAHERQFWLLFPGEFNYDKGLKNAGT